MNESVVPAAQDIFLLSGSKVIEPLEMSKVFGKIDSPIRLPSGIETRSVPSVASQVISPELLRVTVPLPLKVLPLYVTTSSLGIKDV